ncbi:MAG: hypothetical protein JWM91_5074, partial [Rhodospirillales bacterium]|nr:hypothetical protein [Rhodospirillales bacterium]
MADCYSSVVSPASPPKDTYARV